MFRMPHKVSFQARRERSENERTEHHEKFQQTERDGDDAQRRALCSALPAMPTHKAAHSGANATSGGLVSLNAL